MSGLLSNTCPETETNATFHQKLEKSLPCRAVLNKKKMLKENFTQQNDSFENYLMFKYNSSRKPDLANGG